MVQVPIRKARYKSILVRFEYDGKLSGITTHNAPQSYDGTTYWPTGFEVSAVKSSGLAEDEQVNISMPVHDFVSETTKSLVDDLTNTKLRPRGVAVFIYLCLFAEDYPQNPTASRLLIWRGKLKGVKVAEQVLTCEGANINTAFARLSQTRQNSLNCQFPFADGFLCKAQKGFIRRRIDQCSGGWCSFKTSIADGWTPQRDYFRRGQVANGSVEYKGVIYAIRRGWISANDLNVIGVPGWSPGDEITIYTGCDRYFQSCHELHFNANGFGGEPYIPQQNPATDIWG